LQIHFSASDFQLGENGLLHNTDISQLSVSTIEGPPQEAEERLAQMAQHELPPLYQI
jgi:hypothetical protein